MVDGAPGTNEQNNNQAASSDFNVTFDESNANNDQNAQNTGNDNNQNNFEGEYDPSKDTGVAQDVLEWIPEEFREEFSKDPDAKNYTSKEDLFKALLEGKKSTDGMVKIPGEDATEEEINDFYAKLGRPESADKYELDKNLPEGLEFSEDMYDGFTQAAHKAGLSQTQVKSLYDFYNNKTADLTKNLQATIEASYQKSIDEGVAALKQEWGTDYQEKLGQAVKMANTFLSPQTRQYLNATKLGNNPLMIKDFYNLSQKVSGAQFKGGDAPKSTLTLAEIESKLEANLRAPDYTTNKTLQEENKKLAAQAAAIEAKANQQ